MTHYCPDCKSAHNMWCYIRNKEYFCTQCGYVLNLLEEKPNLMGKVDDILTDLQFKRNTQDRIEAKHQLRDHLLSRLPEKEKCKCDDTRKIGTILCVCGAYNCNQAIDLMAERIKEDFGDL